MKKETRLFFVTDSPNVNEEIFETLEEAEQYIKNRKNFLTNDDEPVQETGRIRAAIVRNAYRQEDGSWNYEDNFDTFQFFKEIVVSL